MRHAQLNGLQCAVVSKTLIVKSHRRRTDIVEMYLLLRRGVRPNTNRRKIHYGLFATLDSIVTSAAELSPKPTRMPAFKSRFPRKSRGYVDDHSCGVVSVNRFRISVHARYSTFTIIVLYFVLYSRNSHSPLTARNRSKIERATCFSVKRWNRFFTQFTDRNSTVLCIDFNKFNFENRLIYSAKFVACIIRPLTQTRNYPPHLANSQTIYAVIVRYKCRIHNVNVFRRLY